MTFLLIKSKLILETKTRLKNRVLKINKVLHPRWSENVHQFVPLGSSVCGKIENDPNRSDSRSKVDSEVDLLKNYNQKKKEEEHREAKC